MINIKKYLLEKFEQLIENKNKLLDSYETSIQYFPFSTIFNIKQAEYISAISKDIEEIKKML